MMGLSVTDTDKVEAIFGTTRTLAKTVPVHLILSLCLLGVLSMEAWVSRNEAEERR